MRLMPRSIRILFVALAVCAPSALHAQTLAWDPNPETTVAGYRVHHGTESGKYTTQVDVGKTTQFAPQGFDWSRVRYFAVQAYTSDGLVSPLSVEVKWTPPSATKITSLTANTTYPLLVDRATTWTAVASNNLGPVEYKFWMYRLTGWRLMQDYGSSNTLTWTPTAADEGQPYGVQVWARAVGSAAQYEAWLGTEAFAVTQVPFALTADVDFPTPPGNTVTWTARVASAGTDALEYRFLVQNMSGGGWQVFREYAPSNQAQWTPQAAGTYTIQAWARRVGSTAQYDSQVTTPSLTVSSSPLQITGLSVDTAFPAATGTRVTWTARVQGGTAGPLQYQFWLYSTQKGWTVVQPYGPSQTFAWTPTWTDEGDHKLRVGVRNNGSTAEYDAVRETGTFTIQRAAMNLTTTTLFPAAPGSQIKWLAEVPDPTADLEYQFWVYSASAAAWTLGKPYAVDPTFTWTPTVTGNYAIQAWARQRGSSVAYDIYRGTNLLQISQGPVQIQSLTSSVALPASPGTTIKWTAAASGGTAGPLQYQFWRRDNGVWVMVQDYGPLNSFTWTPKATDIGQHALQVWVRSSGSSVAYEAYKSSGVFSIQ